MGAEAHGRRGSWAPRKTGLLCAFEPVSLCAFEPVSLCAFEPVSLCASFAHHQPMDKTAARSHTHHREGRDLSRSGLSLSTDTRIYAASGEDTPSVLVPKRRPIRATTVVRVNEGSCRAERRPFVRRRSLPRYPSRRPIPCATAFSPCC